MLELLVDDTFENCTPPFFVFLCISAIILWSFAIYYLSELFDELYPTLFFFIYSNYNLFCRAWRTSSIPSFITLSNFPITFSCFLIVYLYIVTRSESFLNFSIFYYKAWILFFWLKITEFNCIVFETCGSITFIDFYKSLFFILYDLYNCDIFMIFYFSYFMFILSIYFWTRLTN